MSQHNEPIPGLHPFLGLIISGILMAVSQIGPQISNVQQWHIPPIVMEMFQVFAWWCIAGSFMITLLNYFGIKWNPFKKRKQ